LFVFSTIPLSNTWLICLFLLFDCLIDWLVTTNKSLCLVGVWMMKQQLSTLTSLVHFFVFLILSLILFHSHINKHNLKIRLNVTHHKLCNSLFLCRSNDIGTSFSQFVIWFKRSPNSWMAHR
jgi:hypothetical protein